MTIVLGANTRSDVAFLLTLWNCFCIDDVWREAADLGLICAKFLSQKIPVSRFSIKNYFFLVCVPRCMCAVW